MNTSPPRPSRKEKLRQWLENHRVFFETIAATLLSIMAIIVSWQQTALTKSQLRREERAEQIQKTADWSDLRSAMWEIMDQWPRDGSGRLATLSSPDWQAWFLKTRKLLDAQHRNPVLISDKQSLGCWRNAISTAKIAEETARSLNEKEYAEFAKIRAESIHKDVFTVWERLVLDSDEVSATGGRPKP